MSTKVRYALCRKARLRWDEARAAHFLLYPERGLALNRTAAFIVQACDGRTSMGAIAVRLAAEFDVPRVQAERDTQALLDALRQRGLLIQVP